MDFLTIWQTLIFITILLWIIALIDILRSNFRGNDKVIWLLAVIFVPFLGAIMYFLIGRKQII